MTHRTQDIVQTVYDHQVTFPMPVWTIAAHHLLLVLDQHVRMTFRWVEVRRVMDHRGMGAK
jgi:hypothetical protein